MVPLRTDGPHVTVYETVRDGHRLVEWSIVDRTRIDEPVYITAFAIQSPLNPGAWLVWRSDGAWTRATCLREARRSVLGGNGHRYRGHTHVDHVRFTPEPYRASQHRLTVAYRAMARRLRMQPVG